MVHLIWLYDMNIVFSLIIRENPVFPINTRQDEDVFVFVWRKGKYPSRMMEKNGGGEQYEKGTAQLHL